MALNRNVARGKTILDFLKRISNYALPEKIHLTIQSESIYIAFKANTRPRDNTLKYMRIADGNVCIDVGANLGLYTRIFLERVGETGRVISFEPNSQNCEILSRLHRRFPTLTVIRKGLSDRCAKALFVTPYENDALVTGLTHSSASMSETIEYLRKFYPDSADFKILIHESELITLDSYISKNPVSEVSWIKIDVEGDEYKVLLGAKAVLRKYKPNVLCEIFEENGADIRDFLRQLDYQIWRFDGESVTQIIGGQSIEDGDYFFVPRGRSISTVAVTNKTKGTAR
jgi:FkbM family methyltransferase